MERSESMTFSAASPPDEDARQLAGKLVNALYRLVKACQLHSETNQAVSQVVEYGMATISQFAERAGVGAASILFTPHAVFVNRQMLKSSRETYQLAIELGAMLEPCGVTEVTVSKDVTPQIVAEFGRIVADATQGKKSTRFEQGGWETLRLRRVVGLGASHDMAPPVRAARTYAAALMILRGFYADLKQGKYELRQGIKRVAQKLVSQFDGPKMNAGGRLLLSIAASPTVDADRASVLLSSGIIACAMANQLNSDRTLLTALTSAALLYDAGRARLTGYDAPSGEARAQRTLNADEEALLPISSVVALTALGKLHPPNLVRTVIVHEAHSLRDGGTVYGGRRSPLLLSRILCVARSFTDLRIPRPGATPLGIDEALQVLEAQAQDNVGRALVKLLTGSLGIFPAGTLIELSTGEMGVVLATPVLPVDFARPPVRILYDTDAQLLADPVDVDLAAPVMPGEPKRFIRRAIDATDQQMKQMRAYVMQLATKRARKKSLAKMQAVKDPSPSQVSGSGPYSHGSSSSALSSSFGSSSAVSSGSFASSPSAGTPGSFGAPPSSGEVAPPSSRPVPSPRDSSDLGFVQPLPIGEVPVAGRPPTARPATRRWDPRSEDAGPAARHIPGVIAPAPSQPGNAPPPPAPSAPKQSLETRSLSWQEYGRELADVIQKPPEREPLSAQGQERAPSSRPSSPSVQESRPAPPGSMPPRGYTGPPPLTETDAILAAYLAEEQTNRDSSAGDMGLDPNSAAGRSFGLRWTGTGKNPLAEQPPSQSADKGFSRPTQTQPHSSQGVDRDSSVGASNAGLRWGGSRTSSQGRESFGDTPISSIPTPTPAPAMKRQETQRSVESPPASIRIPTSPVVQAPSSVSSDRRQSTGPIAPISSNRMPTSSGTPSIRGASLPGKAGTSTWGSPRRSVTGEPPVIEDVKPEQIEEAPVSLPEGTPSKRAKAGTASWGSKPRDGKR